MYRSVWDDNAVGEDTGAGLGRPGYVPDFGHNLSQLTIRNIYLQTVIIDDAQRTSRSENPFLIVLKLSSNDPLYGMVINLALAR